MTEDTLKLALDPASIEEMSPQAQYVRQIAMKSLGKALIRPGGQPLRVGALLKMGQLLRDAKLWEFPILPGAVSVFQQLAAGREWTVSGKPRAVSRTVEWINDAQVVDRTTGMVTYGFENFLQRRVLDYLTIGRTAFAVQKVGRKPPVLEYIDPTYLKFNRDRAYINKPVTDNEVVWQYDERDFKAKEIFIHHPLPIGTSLFISPIAPIIPTATLAWLIREHHMAAVDGRKIRDLIFVANPVLKDAIETAISQVAALWAGEDVSKIGLPIVEMNVPSGAKVSDLFAMLGIARMPESFKEEDFIFMYVNEIAGNLSLALRHFWNSERTTNKALEEVQERRGQMKGPNTFTRTEQRLMNRRGVLDYVGSGEGSKVRFGFVEETDASARLDNASILEKTTRALGAVAKVFGASISPDAYLAWMQALGVLPNDLELIQSTGDNNAVVTSDDSGTGNPQDTTAESDPQPTAFPDPSQKILADSRYWIDYDEVTMDSSGKTVDRRVKTFTVSKMIAAQMIQKQIETPPETAEDAFERGVSAMNQANQTLFRKFWPILDEQVGQWTKTQSIFKKGAVSEAIQACLDSRVLDDKQQAVIDEIVGQFIDEPVGEIT
jgi:phosphatidylglycerophosphatase A